LYAAQLGERSPKAKPLHGLGGQVMEIAVGDASGTCRAIYTISIGEAIYVIHAFQKKSKAGIATPKPEIELIRQRLRQLKSEVKDAEKRSP
jgi:phage-related protein